MKELMKRSQVKQAHSITYLPKTECLVERQNRTLVSMLRVNCSRYMDDWDKHLPQVMGAYSMPTEKGMFVLDTDASVVAISGILHQEQEWNGRSVFRPIAYGSKVLSDTEMKDGASKAEMFAVITFVEKYRA